MGALRPSRLRPERENGWAPSVGRGIQAKPPETRAGERVGTQWGGGIAKPLWRPERRAGGHPSVGRGHPGQAADQSGEQVGTQRGGGGTQAKPPGDQRERAGGHPVWGVVGCGAGALSNRRPLGPRGRKQE